MPHRSVLVCLLALLVAFPTAVMAQFDEEADLIPGLVATYTSGDNKIERIEVDLLHDWTDAAPDPRLPKGPFTAQWSTGLLVRDDIPYTFHAYLQGAVTVEIDGETVLEAESDEPGWVSGAATPLDFGLLELNVAFRKTSDAARMQLYWSSDHFPLEPIPPHQLFREEGRPDLALVETGRQLFAAHRCSRCHVREEAPPSLAAPSLQHVTAGLDRDWLVTKLLGTDPAAAHAKMPSFGFTNDDAHAIATWIESISEPAKLAETPKPKRAKGDDAPTIEQAATTLLHSVGCLACHKVGDRGESGAFGGGDLSHIGAKRSADWLNTWLANPERLNADHHMPVFKLSSNERALLVTALSKLHGDDESFQPSKLSDQPNRELIERGRKLAGAARCAACHKIPNTKADVAGLPSLAEPIADWNNSCLHQFQPVGQTFLSAGKASHHRPFYSRINTEAVKAYVTAYSGRLSSPTLFARGRHVMEQRNCLSCHERDLTKGIVATAGAVAAQIDELRGQSEALIPPALTAVGDKLFDKPLGEWVSGAPKEPRLQWLNVRMPRFNHNTDDKSGLVGYLIGHDRIPDAAPASYQHTPASGGRQPADASNTKSTPKSETKDQGTHVPRSPGGDAQTLIIGRTLAGSGGFNCVACHKFGDYEPRNVALGTKGANLKQIDDRLRPEFFFRWTRDPLRVVPGIEMPSIKKPVDGVLDGNLDAQLAAVWAAINDPDFTAPPNPAQVEQHLVLQPGDAPRIIRDVFTVSESNGGGYVARGLAMGFDNGHSLLFDLDNFTVRGWTVGDFAQQRTEGKSWYWDLAGVEPLAGFNQEPELRLIPTSADEADVTAAIRPAAVHLLEYNGDAAAVRIATLLTFPIDGKDVDVRVEQQFRSWTNEQTQASGIERTITVHDVPDGMLAYAAILERDTTTGRVFSETNSDGPRASPVFAEGEPQTFFYASALTSPPLVPKPRPELPRNDAPVTTLPGFVGRRLMFPSSIMPTAITFPASGGRQPADGSNRETAAKSDRTHRGTDVPRSPGASQPVMMAFTSLKGHVFVASDTDGDGIEDALTEFEEGLAAPFGILADGDSLLVSHKPELLRLRDTDGDGRADERTVVADGWGYTDNYHDWTTGPVRDSAGLLYLALGSDYSQPERPLEFSRWRGKVLRVDPKQPRHERIEVIAHELRFPQGIAIDDQDRLFVTDQQGVANTFNEINHVVAGRHYGVEAMHEEDRDQPETRAAVQVPHPWTRSVNGLMVLPHTLDGPLAPFAGHALGCEYNSRFLIRASFQEVNGELQGATYEFTRPTWEDEAQTFLGPMTVALGPTGDLYVGSIHDSGWLGGQNTGEIVRLSPNGDQMPNGIRELRTTAGGFAIEFLHPVDAARAKDTANYSLSGYTRVWEGSYATPDSGRYSPQIQQITLSDDGRTATLTVDELRPSYVYDVNCAKIDETLFPATAYYTMNRIPSK